MTILNFWVENGVATALGRALAHSLWEGLVVAIALASILALARSSRVRYTAACVAMVAVVLSFGVTVYGLMPQPADHHSVSKTTPGAAISAADSARVPAVPGAWDEQSNLRWLAPLWIVGVLLFQLRFVGAWIMASRLRRTGVCRPAAEWIEKLDHLRGRIRVAKTVTLLESCLAEVPVVIGHLRPVILVPIDLLANLPVGQMESILLHELAHIRRADYLINLMQTVVEGLMFYHPAVWWISGVIRTERENCCDDLVVQANGNAHEYANALAALERNRWAAREMAMAASGGSLTQRIRRLLSEPAAPRAMIAPLVPLGILIAACAVTLAAWPQPALRIVPSIRAVHAPLLFARPQSAAAPAVSPYKKWFDDVTYIITDQERRDWRNLKTDPERDRFIEQFWAKRNPVPGSAKNDYKEEHYRRLAYANDRFSTKSLPGWKTDLGRIYITYGPPDEIESHPSGGTYEESGVSKTTYPFEQWRYRHVDGLGDNIILEFVDRNRTGEYKMTMDPNDKVAALNDAVEAVGSADPELEKAAAAERRALDARLEELAQQSEVLKKEMTKERSLQSNVLDIQEKVAQIQAQSQNAAVTRMQQAMRNLLLAQTANDAQSGAPTNTVFRAAGDGMPALVVVTSERIVIVSIPYGIQAKQYVVKTQTRSSDGGKYSGESATLTNPCERTCPTQDNYITITPPSPPPGSYTLTATVRDVASSNQKTYVVNFSVK